MTRIYVAVYDYESNKLKIYSSNAKIKLVRKIARDLSIDPDTVGTIDDLNEFAQIKLFTTNKNIIMI